MYRLELQEKFSDRFEKLNDSGKRYISAILQSLEFAQFEAKLLNTKENANEKGNNTPNK